MLDKFRVRVLKGEIDALAIAGTMTNKTRDLAISWRGCVDTSSGLLLAAVSMLAHRLRLYIDANDDT